MKFFVKPVWYATLMEVELNFYPSIGDLLDLDIEGLSGKFKVLGITENPTVFHLGAWRDYNRP